MEAMWINRANYVVYFVSEFFYQLLIFYSALLVSLGYCSSLQLLHKSLELCVCLAGTALFILLAGYVFSPWKRGFYCNDESIRQPLLDHSVTMAHLLYVTLLVPYVSIMFGEAFLFASSSSVTDRLRKYFASTTGIVLEYLAGLSII